MEQNKSEEVLLNVFNVGKKRFKVFFHQNVIKWQRLKHDKGRSTSVSLNDVINVTIKPHDSLNRNINGNYQIHPSYDIGSPSAIASPTAEFKEFTVHYATTTNKRDSSELKYNSISFCSSDFNLIRHWFITLHESLRVFKQTRPKNLLLFVNPYSGKRNALIVYEKYAKPLFQIANVNVTCIISQKANQISDIIMEQNLDRFDGLVVVGGDGTFSEAFNGLIRKYLHLNTHLQLDDDAFARSITLPIGVIGSGSTDCVAYSLYGTSEPTTAVLNIILGDKFGLDLSSIRNEDNLLIRMYCSALSYGFLGDVVRKSEKYRKWLGPKRYDFTGFKEFFKNNGYDVEITYLVDDHAVDNRQICCSNCSRCAKLTQSNEILDEFKSDIIGECNNEIKHTWKTVTGKFFLISAANIKCACPKSPNGISPSCHFSDGYIDIIFVKHTNLLNNIKLLLALTGPNKDVSDFNFVEKIRTRKFKFRALDAKDTTDDYVTSTSTQPIQTRSMRYDLKDGLSSFNCDGEILLDSYVTVSGHRQLLKVFKKSTFPPSI